MFSADDAAAVAKRSSGSYLCLWSRRQLSKFKEIDDESQR
jgi:hypothetical protein